VVRVLFGTINGLGLRCAATQVCLAHLLRDARYAVECGDVALSAAFKRLPLRAIAIRWRRDTLKDTTLKQYHAELDHRLDRIMAAVPIPGSSPGT
jgi:transposase